MADAAAPTKEMTAEQAIEQARAQIDAIDMQILGILADRVRCNEVIAAAKQASGVTMPLRPAREVKMMRRLIEAAPPGVDRDLIFDVWRSMIAANVRRQRAVEIVVPKADDTIRLFDIARRHFSGSAQISTTIDTRDALARAATQPGTVAVMPWLGPVGISAWWAMLPERRLSGLSIIAALPMTGDGEPEAAIVAADAVLDPAGDDQTFILAFDPHHRAQRALNEAGLRGKVLRVRETIMLQVEGFVTRGDLRMTTLAREGLEGARIVGSYARI